jgi:uncharacterized protein (DUF433 family)
MMAAPTFRLIGHGVYSLTEAERLTKIPRQRLRRWMEGYRFVSSGKRHHSAPIIDSDVGRAAGELALTFSDLIEVRFLEAFLQHGVSWRTVRIAAERARDLLGRTHPFSTKIFRTDGRYILAEIAGPGGVPELLNLVKNQWEFAKVVSPMLYAGLEFNEYDEPERWWPMTKRRTVVIDPERAFGAPIAVEGGVQTRILATAARSEGSQRRAAALYDVPVRAVRHAVEYETRYLA